MGGARLEMVCGLGVGIRFRRCIQIRLQLCRAAEQELRAEGLGTRVYGLGRRVKGVEFRD